MTVRICSGWVSAKVPATQASFLFGGENDNHNVDMMNPDLEFSTNKLCGFECSILRRNRKFHPQVQC